MVGATVPMGHRMFIGPSHHHDVISVKGKGKICEGSRPANTADTMNTETSDLEPEMDAAPWE
jgi:hypothetical protein